MIKTFFTARECRIGVCTFTAVIASLLVASSSVAQVGTLAEPFPSATQNAALHYQRALLHLARVERSQTGSLDKPIWEALPQHASTPFPKSLADLLSRGRFAVASATKGSRAENCDFGIDFENAGAGAQLPHVDDMVRLGRLLTLRGVQAQVRGDWEEAVIIYFDGIRIGRHLASQSTLLEALAGIEILRNNYYALARWSVRCPSRLLVARAFGLLESMQAGLVNPSRVLAREASILTLDFRRLSEAYPKGDWAGQILDSYGIARTGKAVEDRKSAIAACVERGVPATVFESEQAFEVYLERLQAVGNRYVEAVAACMALPPKARLKRAASLNKKYSEVIPVLATETLIDPVEVAALFAQHEAELALTRVTLAVAASARKSEGFPKSLDLVDARFGGATPVDPYRSEAIKYRVGEKGKSFSLEIPSAGPLDGVSFDSEIPQPAE